MDWNLAIERNREALKRILASLIAMAGVAAAPSRGPDEGRTQGRPTLPRHLHRAVLRLLRPAEAAARRLVIIAARDVVVPPPSPSRPRKPKQRPAILRGRHGTGIILPPNHPDRVEVRPRRTLSLPLVDALSRWRRSRPAANSVPRISLPGLYAPFPVPVRRPPAPGDPIDAARLNLRLAALTRVLDDLPREARRFARWKMRRERGLVRRISPLRPGRPPGRHSASSRRPAHEVHDVLGDLHWFAYKALQPNDTS